MPPDNWRGKLILDKRTVIQCLSNSQRYTTSHCPAATVPCPLLSAANSDGMPALRNLVEHHQRSAHLLVLPGIERCRLTVTASVAVDEIPDDGFLDIETPP